jgi:hypothetical protein
MTILLIIKKKLFFLFQFKKQFEVFRSKSPIQTKLN